MQKTRENTRTVKKPDVRKFKPESSGKDDFIFEKIMRDLRKDNMVRHAGRSGVLRPCIPDLIRKLNDLKYIGGPLFVPDWITPLYIANCMENGTFQDEWVPKRGDWYLDSDLCSLRKIGSRKEYDKVYAPPPIDNWEKARTKNGRWHWHFYLPRPQFYLCMCPRELTMDEMRHISIGVKCNISFVGKVLNEDRWDYNIDGTVLTAKDKEVVKAYGLIITNDL
jgi:hypothetical protein